MPVCALACVLVGVLALAPGPVRAQDAIPLPEPAPARIPLEPPPPTAVDRVLQEILVERDLDAARSLLHESLVKALNQVENVQWTARVYALLMAISVLEGDLTQGTRLALRAVALDPAVRLEAQLGPQVLEVLEQARADWRARPSSAQLEVAELPGGLLLVADGVALETPLVVYLKPGDHLLQIVGRLGVIARSWVTAEPGALLTEPPPIPAVREVLKPREKPPPVDPDELSSLLDRARSAESELQTLATEVDLSLQTARAASDVRRAACLAQLSVELSRIEEAIEDYRGRLNSALQEDDASRVRHLFSMIDLAAGEAGRRRDQLESCHGQSDPHRPVEVRVSENLEGSRMPRAAVPVTDPYLDGLGWLTDSRRHLALAPDLSSPLADAQPIPSLRALGAEPGAWRAQAILEAYADTNPFRLPTLTPLPSDLVSASLEELDLGAQLGLALRLEHGPLRLMARAHERFGAKQTWWDAIELGLALQHDGIDASQSRYVSIHLHQSRLFLEPFWAWTALHRGPFLQRQVELRGGTFAHPALALQGRLALVAGLEQLGLADGAARSRLSTRLQSGLDRRLYPHTVWTVAGELQVHHWIEAAEEDSASAALGLPWGMEDVMLAQGRGGLRTRLAAPLWGELVLGIQSARVRERAAHTWPLTVPESLGGGGRLELKMPGGTGALRLERTLRAPLYADLERLDRLRLDWRSLEEGRFRVRAWGALGRERLYFGDNLVHAASGLTGWWQPLTLAEGLLKLGTRLAAPRADFWLDLELASSLRWGVPGYGLEDAGPVRSLAVQTSTHVHRLFLSLTVQL